MGGTQSAPAQVTNKRQRTHTGSSELRRLQTYGSPWICDTKASTRSIRQTRERTDESGILIGPSFQAENLPSPTRCTGAPDRAVLIDEYEVAWDGAPRPVDAFHAIAKRYFALPPQERNDARRKFDVVLNTLEENKGRRLA